MELLFAAEPAANGITTIIVSLVTLILLEIVLGIDNVIFISILSSKLPAQQQSRARIMGIGLAVISRIALLLAINWVKSLTEPLLNIFGNEVSGRDLILLIGGIFLIGKSTFEIHEKLEAAESKSAVNAAATSLISVLVQIMLIDVIFSLDSVITAVGIANEIWVMIAAVIVAAVVMMFFSGIISRFVDKHPSMKILALAFLIMIGVMLVIEGWNAELAEGLHIKNYAYVAMAFSFTVEMLNIQFRKHQGAVHLHNTPHAAPEPAVALAGRTKSRKNRN